MFKLCDILTTMQYVVAFVVLSTFKIIVEERNVLISSGLHEEPFHNRGNMCWIYGYFSLFASNMVTIGGMFVNYGFECLAYDGQMVHDYYFRVLLLCTIVWMFFTSWFCCFVQLYEWFFYFIVPLLCTIIWMCIVEKISNWLIHDYDFMVLLLCTIVWMFLTSWFHCFCTIEWMFILGKISNWLIHDFYFKVLLLCTIVWMFVIGEILNWMISDGISCLYTNTPTFFF